MPYSAAVAAAPSKRSANAARAAPKRSAAAGRSGPKAPQSATGTAPKNSGTAARVAPKRSRGRAAPEPSGGPVPAPVGEPKDVATVVVRRLAKEYPGTAKELCALCFDSPFQLLVATILSAQTTDERVNMVTPELFARYPDAPSMAGANPGVLEDLIRSTGFFRSKTRSLVGMSAAVTERFGGEVPRDLDDLVTLPGVGRKTANVVRSVAFGLPGLAVDTHVGRLSRRLCLTTAQDPDRVEAELNEIVPPQERGPLSLRLILHGRRICTARAPHCARCVLADVCPSAGTGQPPPPTARVSASQRATKTARAGSGTRARSAPG